MEGVTTDYTGFEKYLPKCIEEDKVIKVSCIHHYDGNCTAMKVYHLCDKMKKAYLERKLSIMLGGM